MSDQKQTNERNSLQILAKAADSYLASLDELARNFTAPQVQAAVQILSNLISETYAGPVVSEEPKSSEPATA